MHCSVTAEISESAILPVMGPCAVDVITPQKQCKSASLNPDGKQSIGRGGRPLYEQFSLVDHALPEVGEGLPNVRSEQSNSRLVRSHSDHVCTGYLLPITTSCWFGE